MKAIILSLLALALFAGCPPPSYVYMQSEIIDFEKATFNEIDRTVFPSNVQSMQNKNKKTMWTGLVRSFNWDDANRIARFSVEHRFVLRVPYPLTSSGLKLLGHPDYYYVSRESEGEFDCTLKLRQQPDTASVNAMLNQTYAFTFIGRIASPDKPILLAANFLERFPLSGEIDVIVPRDSSGKVLFDKNGNIAFKIKKNEENQDK